MPDPELVIVYKDYMDDTADSIRAKLGTQRRYGAAEFSEAIDQISGGGVIVEPLSVTVNDVYTAPAGKAYSPVTVNVPGGGPTDIIYGTSAPTADIGQNNDYYYQRIQNSFGIRKSGSWGSSTAVNSGIQFRPTEDITVVGLRGMTKTTKTGGIRIGTTSTILATVSNVDFVADTPKEVMLDSPITLTAGTDYIVQLILGSGGGAAYTNNSNQIKDIVLDSRIQYIQARYGSSYPGNTESGSYVFSDIIMDEDRYYIDAQYIKENGSWITIG